MVDAADTPALPSRADVEAAAERIAPHVRRTPSIRVALAGVDVWLKLEQLQITGSFKARGAVNALLALPERPSAVVTASGGNHGLGVAHAAAVVGAQPTVVVPDAVPPEKARRLAEAGATVIRHGVQYADAEEYARHLADAQGVPFLHPFGDPAVIAGQGTVALEVLADTDSDVLVAAVGGGGLLAGCVLACEGTGVRVLGVEPVGIPTMHDALAAGRPVDVAVESVSASALGARRTSQINLAVIRERTAGVVLVDDDAILTARDLLWEECRLAVEPAAAAGVAALLGGLVDAARPCVVLCGANSGWAPEA